MRISIQSTHRDSREALAIIQANNNLEDPLPVDFSKYGHTLKYCDPHIIIGSVEFLEAAIGQRIPNFYPDWTKSAWHRKIVIFDDAPYFVKGISRYKNQGPFSGEPFIDYVAVSERVRFVDEWRYYVANGKVLCSWWYKGDDDDCDKCPNGPELPFDIPAEFCGAIDMGLRVNGELALVEVQHPYAIGWYGEMSQSDLYFKFMLEGAKFLSDRKKI